jgi:glycosyltransferase involved in cell wall biosynthesis
MPFVCSMTLHTVEKSRLRDKWKAAMVNLAAGPRKVNSWIINGRFLSQQVTGVQRYAEEIVWAMDEILSQDQNLAAHLRMRLVFPPRARSNPVLSKITVEETRFGSGHAWDQFILPLRSKTGTLSLGNLGPVTARNHIVCIHDANTFIEPQSYSRTFGSLYRILLPLMGTTARRVATVSQFSAKALVDHKIARAEKIFIAPNGHEHALRWNPDASDISFPGNLKRPYVLLLGSSAKHKNIDVLVRQAVALDMAGIDIVIVGGTFGIFADGSATASQPNVHRAGYVADNDLAALYANAICLVFPSKTEGFGIPPLEAMARRCPVISSNAASLMEVGGDAVLYVDPDDSQGWRDAIIGLSTNDDLRNSLKERGRKRAKLFSWRRSAEIYLNEILRLTAA